jgi:hypothetical protein
MKKLLVFIGFLLAIQVNAQTVKQQIGLKKGEQYSAVNKMEIVIAQELMGQVLEVFMISNTTNIVDIKDVSANKIDLTSSLARFSMEVDAMGQQINMNSDNPDQAGELSKLLNVPNEYVLDNSGKITSVVKNTPDVENNAMGDMSGNVGEVEKVGNVFSLLASIPAAGVKVGETWSETIEDEGVTTTSTYTLKSVNNGVGTVEMEVDIKMERTLNQQGIDMFMNLTGKGKGEFTFDTNTLVVKTKNLNTSSSGTIEAMGQLIPMSIETKLVSENSKK